MAAPRPSRSFPVVRDVGFIRVHPTSFSLWSLNADGGDRVEVILQRVATRELAHHFGAGAQGPNTLVSKDVRAEVHELAAMELSRDTLLKLRDEIDQFLERTDIDGQSRVPPPRGLAPTDPKSQPQPDRPARTEPQIGEHILEVTRTELAGVHAHLASQMDALAARIEEWGDKMTSVRSALAADLADLLKAVLPRAKRLE